MSMTRRDIERFEATRLRKELHQKIDDLDDKELLEFSKIAKDYKKIGAFLEFIKTLK